MLMYLTIIDSKEGQQKFEFIYNRYKKLMFYIANKILGDTRDSEDTVHDAFLKIIEIIDDIKDVESPQTRSLIVTITENKAIDLYRKRQRKTVLPFEEEYLGVPNCSDIESVEDNEVVTKAIASLSGKYREVLFLKYSHGYSIDDDKKENERRLKLMAQEHEQTIEKWRTTLEAERAESAHQKRLNENLLRIARERANADRKLKPKKEHTGYVVVVSSEKIYRYKHGRRLESVKLWETVIQSPYSIEFPAKQAKKLILEEFFPENGEWEAARLGIERWVAGDYEDFLSAADKDEEFIQQNTALTGYRSFRANYRAGYWEMILVHTRPLEVVPKDMRVS